MSATKKKPAAKPRRKKPAPVPPAKVLVLRSCRADGGSHNGWKYPLTVGAMVEAPDWNPKAECGGGLHGLLWGQGDTSLLCWDSDAWWQVFECDAADVVEIDKAKCKFRRGVQVFLQQGLSPGFPLAQAYLIANDSRKSPSSVIGDYSKAASSGDYSKAASSGNYSTAASSGYGSKAASSGDYSKAASSGDGSTAASSGYGSTAEASGSRTVAMVAGPGGRARAGVAGAFALAWLDGERIRIAVGHVGEDGIEADTWYRVGEAGKLVKA